MSDLFSARLCIFLVLLAGIANPVRAQEDAATPESAPAADTSRENWNRLIYVPFRELQKVSNNDDATAVVPYSEYMKLLKNYLREKAADAPDAIITRSDYSATVEEDVARVSLELKVTVLKTEGWARLPLKFGQVAVGKVTSDDDEQTILKGVDDGRYELLLRGIGERTVTLELLAAVTTSPEARSFELHCPAVGISELSVSIPEAEQTVRIAPVEVLLPEDESDATKTVAKAALGAVTQFSVSWFPKAGTRPDMDLLASVTNHTTVQIEPQLIQTQANLKWEVLRGDLREVTVLVPKDARIIDVAADTGRLESWDAEVQDNQQRIRMTLLNPVSDTFSVTVQTERDPEDNTFQVIGRDDSGALYGIHAKGVVREAGRVRVKTDSTLTLIPETQSGVKRVSGEESDGPVWEFSGDRGRLVVQVKPVEPRLLVTQDASVIFSDDELRLNTHLNYTVERAGVFELKLKYPESLTIENVQADGMSEFNVDKTGGIITLALTNRRMGDIGVDIRGKQAFDAAATNAETTLPAIEPQDVERSDGTLTVYAPQFLDVVTDDENRTGLNPARGDTRPAIGRALPVSIWNFTQQPWTMSVRTSPRPAQVDAIVGTTVQVEPEIVRFNSRLQFNIRNAGIDTFRVAVPEAIADDVRFKSLNANQVIQQRNKASEPDDGWVTWTLVLQDEITGVVQLSAEWDVQLGEADDDAVRSVAVEPVRVLSPFPDDADQKRRVTLTAVRGEIRLLRHDSLSINAEPAGETTESIDVRELEQLPREGFLAFRYFEQPASATVSIRQHEIHDVVETVVSRAAIEIVTEKQSLAGYRCRYRITSSERQRLLVRVPFGSELQAPLLDGRRTTFEPADDVEAEDNRDAYYVNVSRKEQSDDGFLLSFQFRCPIVDADRFPYEGQGGHQLLRIPVIGESSGNTVVQETRVGLWTPKDVSIFGEPDNWSRVGRQRWSLWRPLESPDTVQTGTLLSRWIGDESSSDFALQGHATQFQSLGSQPTLQASWWNWPFLVAIVSGALVLIGLLLRKTSWENRITIVLLGAVAVAIWALSDSDAAYQMVSAGMIGLIAVAALWLTGLLLGKPRGAVAADGSSSPPPSTEPGSSPPPAAPQPVAGVEVSTGPPGTVTPAPGLKDTMDKLMGGK